MANFPRHRIVSASTVLVLCVSLTGCESGNRPPLSGSTEWSIDAAPLVTIGGADDRLEYIVYKPVGATRLVDGRIAVASQAASEVKFFAPDGTHIYTAGREGQGPGEYTGIMNFHKLPGDTLLVVSIRPGLTWLTAEGQYLRSESADLWGRARHPCRISRERLAGTR